LRTIGLCLLRLGQLGVALPQHVVQLHNLPGPVLQIGREQPLRLFGLSGGNSAAFLVKLVRHFGADILSGGGDLRLLVADGCFSTGDIGLLAGDLILSAASDSVSLISVRQAGQVSVSSVMVGVSKSGRESSHGTGCPSRNSRC
jgi:hypothetical protein